MTQPAFLALGDIHLDHLIWRRQRDIADDSLTAFRSFLDHAIRLRIPAVIVGDLFDTTDPESSLVRFFREQMSRCADAGIPVYAIQGNHDKRPGVPWYVACSPHPIHFGDGRPVVIGGLQVVGFDYAVRDVIERQLADLHAELESGGRPPQVLMLHQAVRQALRFEGAHNCDLDWVHPAIPLTVLGDIHRPCDMSTPGGRALYTGSSHPRSLEELGPKTCVLVNDDLTVDRLPLEQRFFARLVWTEDASIDADQVVAGIRFELGRKPTLRPAVWLRYSPERSTVAQELIARLHVESVIVVDEPMVGRSSIEPSAEQVDTSDLPKLPELLARLIDPTVDRFAYQMTLALMDQTTNPVDLIREERDRFMAAGPGASN